MLHRITPAHLTLPAAAAIVVGLTVPILHASAAPQGAGECVQAGNVWVHVAYDETVTGACATEFATAQDAISSAGVSEDDGWIQTVDDRLAKDKEWWSIYTLSPDAKGSYAVDWAFAQVGAAELTLKASDVLALQLQEDYDRDSVAPAANPVEGVVLGSPAAAPAPTAEAQPGMPKSGY